MESYRQYRELRRITEQQVARSTGSQTDGGDDSDAPQDPLERGLARNPSDADIDNVVEKKGKLVVESGSKESGDPCNAHGWSMRKRLRATSILFLIVLALGWGSSCESNIVEPAARDLDVSPEAETVSTGLFMMGLATGALMAGPLSEALGRNPIYLSSSFLFLCFTLGSALCPNYGAQLAFRFLAGLFSSPTLAIYGGSLSDLWTPEERSIVWPIFALSPVLGPILSPIAAGWLQEANIDWRWTYWISLIFGGVSWIVAMLFMPETLPSVLLDWKAKHLRALTKDERWTSPKALKEGLMERLGKQLKLPVTFFSTEPIIIFLGLYLVVIYIVNFTFLSGFTFIFTDTYGLSAGIASLAFVGSTVGALISTALTPLFFAWQKRDVRKYQAKHDEEVESASTEDDDDDDPRKVIGPPELRLYPAMFAAPLLAISLFWLAWTNFRSINALSGYGATVLFGYALTAIFVTSYQYIIDSYEEASSTALGSITTVRYLAGGAMIIVARPMYQNLSPRWALTLLGCLSVVLIPVPFVLYKYGKAMRHKSKFAR